MRIQFSIIVSIIARVWPSLAVTNYYILEQITQEYRHGTFTNW